MALKKRQRIILDALYDSGDVATEKQIAYKTGLNMNIVFQILSTVEMIKYVEYIGGTKWKLISDEYKQLPLFKK
jgi:transcription initiation factor IIE alpha subunit